VWLRPADTQAQSAPEGAAVMERIAAALERLSWAWLAAPPWPAPAVAARPALDAETRRCRWRGDTLVDDATRNVVGSVRQDKDGRWWASWPGGGEHHDLDYSLDGAVGLVERWADVRGLEVV
jgi:hypothetical protein